MFVNTIPLSSIKALSRKTRRGNLAEEVACVPGGTRIVGFWWILIRVRLGGSSACVGRAGAAWFLLIAALNVSPIAHAHGIGRRMV